MVHVCVCVCVYMYVHALRALHAHLNKSNVRPWHLRSGPCCMYTQMREDVTQLLHWEMSE
jgi:hypothetical protein